MQHTDINIITTNITILIQTLITIQIIVIIIILMIIITTIIIILGRRWKRWTSGRSTRGKKVLIVTVGRHGAAVGLWKIPPISRNVLCWDPRRSLWIQSLKEETKSTSAAKSANPLVRRWSRTCWQKLPVESKSGDVFMVHSSGLEKIAKENGGLFSPILSGKTKRHFLIQKVQWAVLKPRNEFLFFD